ncbi:MAG: Wadjet anti-phage system protein JetD domain-containing protein [Parafannyhessea sp.]|uniref:Wadjet anti-phage system protein JetD domain-containing protein n=1 Tax=Parafannyhessea sp. TaxID=2847324 RepID=UPI003F116148
MARKLTGQERDDAEALRDALVQALGPADRGYAPGISSALVRVKGDRVSADDLDRIMGKYDVSNTALKRMVKAGILVPADDAKGSYDLCIPTVEDAGEEAQGDSDPAPEAGSDPNAEEPVPADGANDSQAEVDVDAGAPEPDAPVAASDSDADVSADAPETSAEANAAATTSDSTDAGEKDAPDAPEAASADDAAPQPEPAANGKQPGNARRRKEQPRRELKSVPYVRRGSEADAEARQKIVQLDPRFWMNGWLLSHPGAYTMYEREITAINDVLTDGMLPGDITRRQLAYQMGGDEKFFEYGSDGFRLLRAMGMEDVVRHRPMPKSDLVYHAPRRRKHMRVLVTENLDPYQDVHDLMYEDGRTQILGERVHAVVLGGGTPVLEHNRLSLLLDTLGADTVEVLYWGDIDRAGVDLMMKLKAELGEKYKFTSFSPAYKLMVDRAMERFPDPADNESTGQAKLDVPDMSLMCEGLSPEEADYARAVVEACGLIPQEILTKRDL